MLLLRFSSSDEGTKGILINGNDTYKALELPNRDNRPNVSCIPEGTYKVTKRYSPHFKRELFWLHDVPNRSFILIHPANFAGDVNKGYQSHLQGCIALGKKFGRFKNKFGKEQLAILNSRVAINDFYSKAGDGFELTIKDVSC